MKKVVVRWIFIIICVVILVIDLVGFWKYKLKGTKYQVATSADTANDTAIEENTEPEIDYEELTNKDFSDGEKLFITNINKLSEKTILIISIILITLFIIDVIISLTIVFKLKFVSKNIKKDSTLDIKNAIKKFIKNDIYVYERIIESFPNLTKSLKEKALKLKKKSKITQ